jgi:predicted O-methyltransferase YrrM
MLERIMIFSDANMVNLDNVSGLIKTNLKYFISHKPIYESKPPLTDIAFDKCEFKGYDLIAGPSTLLSYCIGKDAIEEVIEVLEVLEKDKYTQYLINYYREGFKKFGEKWFYADVTTVLIGLSGIIRPKSYLEIGLRRGRSLAIVLSKSPDCNVVGFDMWIQNYAGMDNPGSDFVIKEMKKFNYSGKLEFINGDSHDTMPKYLRQNPKAYFDLITIDGDHSKHGASIDFTHALPRLKVGGAIVFDDIAHPYHPSLIKIWNKYIVSDPRFTSYSFTELGYGIGFAIRKY